MKLYRKSKNLIPFPYSGIKNGETRYGITFTIDDNGVITANGVGIESTGGFNIVLRDYFPVTAGQTFSFSSSAFKDKSDYTMYLLVYTDKGASNPLWVVEFAGGRTYTIPEGYTYGRLVMHYASGAVIENVVFKPMLNEGTTALPYEPYAGQRVKLLYGSKNLFDEKAFSELSSVSEDTYNGENCYKLAPKGVNNKIPFKAKAGETITLSIDIAAPNGMDMYWFVEDAEGNGRCPIGESASGANPNFQTKKGSITLPYDGEYINIRCYAVMRYTPYYIKNIMLNKGTTALPYDKYFPLSKMNLYLKSRNLIPYPYTRLPSEQNGITITDNGDGTFYLNGTNTAGKAFNLYLSPEGMEAPFEVGEAFAISTGVSKTYAYASYFKEDGTIETLSGDVGKVGNYKIWGEGWKLRHIIVQIAASAVYDNVLVKPMLNEGITALPYEPPQEYPN